LAEAVLRREEVAVAVEDLLSSAWVACRAWEEEAFLEAGLLVVELQQDH
jgi:hypothetical protein